MANTNLVNDIVLPDSMVHFRNNTVLTNAIGPQYDATYEAFGAKPGATINLRTHQLFEVREDTLEMNVAGVQQKEVALTKSKIMGIDILYNDAELTQDVDGFMENRAEPAMAQLAAKWDKWANQTLYSQIANCVPLPATAYDADDILDAATILDEESTPARDRTTLLSPRGNRQLMSSSKEYFNNSSKISKNYDDGLITVPQLGFDFGTSQNVASHTTGGYDANYVVNTAPTASGDATLSIDTGTGTILKGDTFQIANVIGVDKLTKTSTGQARFFVATADSAGGTVSLAIDPPMISEGAYQNIDALPVTGAALTFMGVASTTYRQGLHFHKNFAAIGFVDLPIPTELGVKGYRMAEDGISMSVMHGYDIKSRQQLMRFDIMGGAVATEPTMANRSYQPA